MCITLILCSCQSDNNEEVYVENYEELIQVSKDIDFGDTSYNIETDSQNYYNFNDRQCAAVRDGYYTFKILDNLDLQLVFIDRDTLKSIPVCSKADCMHDGIECDAYFDESVYLLNYYDGSLYTILGDRNENVITYYLYRISLDGSVRQKAFDIYSADETGSVYPKFIIHRGYVYCFYENGEDYHMAKIDVDGDNLHDIYSIDSEMGKLYNINGYGDGVLFCDRSNINETYSYRMLYYSETSDEVYEIADNIYWQYAATENGIVYTDGSDIYIVNTADMTREIFIEDISGMVSIKYDGKYLYIDNVGVLWNFEELEKSDYSSRKIDVYDLNGNLIDTIPVANQGRDAEIGDEEYIFLTFSENGSSTKKAFDKSQIGTGNHEWREIEGLSR